MINDLFLTEDQVADGILLLKEELEVKVNEHDGDAVATRIIEFISLQAYASQVLASAEKYKRSNPKSADYQGLFLYAERISKSISYAIEGLRSILSNLKEERKNTKTGYL